MPPKRKSTKPAASARSANGSDSKVGNGSAGLIKELWEAAVTLRGSIEPADYKRYVLPIIFLRFLSMRYEKRREELEKLIANPHSDYYTDDPKVVQSTIEDPDEYRSATSLSCRRRRAGNT